MRAILQFVASARRPVILAGAGVLRARTSTDLLKLAELLDVPVIAGWRRGKEVHLKANVDESLAKSPSVEKVVVVSSSGTIAVGTTPAVHDETSGYKNEVVGEWPYYLSKIFAEKLALDYQARAGLNVVVVNPSLLLGIGDERNSSTRDVALFLQGETKVMPNGGLNFVHVREVAHGLTLGIRSGNPRESSLMGNAQWTLSQLIA